MARGIIKKLLGRLIEMAIKVVDIRKNSNVLEYHISNDSVAIRFYATQEEQDITTILVTVKRDSVNFLKSYEKPLLINYT